MTDITDIYRVYQGSNGDDTKALYAQLEQHGARGRVALNLFRACKASERAKKYRGGDGRKSYRGMAYERKAYSIEQLCIALLLEAGKLNIRWGWKPDPGMSPDAPHRDVVYVEIPTGQVSFHSAYRGAGPEYPGDWDRAVGTAPQRICTWIHAILVGQPSQGATP